MSAYSVCLTVMEVSRSPDSALLTKCTGQEVALFVKKYFAKELVKLASYKSQDYKAALEQTFFKMDSLMETTKGK